MFGKQKLSIEKVNPWCDSFRMMSVVQDWRSSRVVSSPM